MRHSINRRRTMAAVASFAVLGLSACGGSDSGGGSTTTSPSGSASASGDADCEALKPFGDIKGKSVSVYTSIVTPEDKAHKDSYKKFEECTGATVKYEGSKEFEAQLPIRVAGGNAPDIAYIPQPGLLKTLVKTGKAKAAPEETSKNVDEMFGDDWKAYGSVDGTFYAAPLGANVKSFVWYSPKDFKDAGYEIPQSWDGLMKLTQKIADDNKGQQDVKPWCIGIASGEATGWPATDWLEDVLLRTAGPEVYDQWVKHEIPFNAPPIVDALGKVADIWKNPAFVNGGFGDIKTIASTTFQDAGQPILEKNCFMHRQAGFYAANWPKGTKIGEDGDVFAFYLPPVDETKGKPVLGGGEFVLAFTDRPEVKAFQTYLSSELWANEKAKATPDGGWVSANKKLDVNNLTSPIDKLSAQILQDPKAVFRFDGSDQMPSAVGSGTFWKGMTNWVLGKDDKSTLDYIEASWKK